MYSPQYSIKPGIQAVYMEGGKCTWRESDVHVCVQCGTIMKANVRVYVYTIVSFAKGRMYMYT